MGTAEFFKQYTEAYDRVTPALSVYRELIQLHLGALQDRDKVLESGCGPGTLVVELLRHGAEVHAIDQNQAALDMLKAKTSGYENKLKLYCQDAHQLPFPDEFFDGVSSMLVLPFMEQPVKYLKEHARVLRKGGIFVVSGPDQEARDQTGWMMAQCKEDLQNQGLWEKLQDDWKTIERYTKESVNVNIKTWYSLEEVSRILSKDIGLVVTEKVTNPMYYGRGYFVTAEKREE